MNEFQNALPGLLSGLITTFEILAIAVGGLALGTILALMRFI